MKPHFGFIVAMMSASIATAQPVLSPVLRSPVIAQSKVSGWDAAGGQVRMQEGQSGVTQPGDCFWVVDDEQMCAAGTVTEVSPRECVGRVTSLVRAPATGDQVLLAHVAGLKSLREAMPPGTTLHGRLSRVPPGRHTGWVDLGRRSGLADGDTLVVRRKGLPIARGQISLLQDSFALLSMRALVGNALPEADDVVELWPSPAEARGGRINTTVLDCRPPDKGTVLMLAGAEQDGLKPKRGVDLFRGGGYVGVATISEASDLLAVAQLIESASAMPPQVGDEAVVRAGAGAVRPLRVPVFKVERDKYCLLAAGENDGVTMDEKFIVRRLTPDAQGLEDIAELRVRAVKVDYCDADIKLLNAGAKLLPWDFAERISPPWEYWLPIGMVRTGHMEARTLLADIDPKAAPKPGDVLRCTADDKDHPRPAAAVVVHCWRDAALLYVPPGWGDPAKLGHARVERQTPLP